jgi:hypothetical protein
MAVHRIHLIGQTPSVGSKREIMYPSDQVAYDPYAYSDPTVPQYCGPNYYVVPYPSLTVSYDPYWPGRVAPTTRPLELVPPPGSVRRFRGEVRVGNCLLIYE